MPQASANDLGLPGPADLAHLQEASEPAYWHRDRIGPPVRIIGGHRPNGQMSVRTTFDLRSGIVEPVAHSAPDVLPAATKLPTHVSREP
jgi:hypothetical protein